MRAEEMFKAINTTDECDGIEEWLKETLLKCFIAAGRNTCTVLESSIAWPKRDFMAAMSELGYVVNITSVGQGWGDIGYEITIPPQPPSSL